jgi:hypothetical protein
VVVQPQAPQARDLRQAKIDGRGVQRVDRFLQVYAKGFVEIELARYADQALREVGIDPPIAHFVGIRQRAAGDAASNAHVVQLLALRPQARLDVAQTLAVGQLGERQAQKLLEAAEALDLVLAPVRRHTPAKCRQRQMLGQLCKNQLACMHERYPRKWSSQARIGAYSS